MLYVSANDVSRCKPLLIFREKDGDKNTRIKKEMTQYDSEVVVQWNDKTYCNATVMTKWLKQQYKYATIELHNSTIKRLLFLNVFADQKTSEISIHNSFSFIAYFDETAD